MTERGKFDAKRLVRETVAEIAALKVRNVPALRGACLPDCAAGIA
jgi:hypothetical protein